MEEKIMNIVYDLVLNFSKVGYLREFYEWDKNDVAIIIEKIPIFRVNQSQLMDIFKSYIQVDRDFLKKIYHKTYTEFGLIDYCCLVTDFSRVLALKFNSDGKVIEQSTLLLDEEIAVIEENYDLKEIVFHYTILKFFNNNCFLTRKEKKIQKYLVSELKKMYDLKIYDEIEYLYYEMFSETKKINEMYDVLLSCIQSEFNEKMYGVYDIIKMISVNN